MIITAHSLIEAIPGVYFRHETKSSRNLSSTVIFYPSRLASRHPSINSLCKRVHQEINLLLGDDVWWCNKHVVATDAIGRALHARVHNETVRHACIANEIAYRKADRKASLGGFIGYEFDSDEKTLTTDNLCKKESAQHSAHPV